jgi:hypothetical protein
MKNQLKTLVKILLPAAVLAGSAAAQQMTILPGALGATRVHCPGPVILAPMVLASDVGYLAMPIPVLPRNPLAPMPRVAPVTPEIMPMMPARPAMPITPIRYAALGVALSAPSSTAPAKADAQGRKLEELYDGRPAEAAKSAVESRPAPVSPSRRISFPERDLEAEIGAY